MKLLEIESGIAKLNEGNFQLLCDELLRQHLHIEKHPLGTQLGTAKTTKGTPDAYFIKNGKNILAEYTTQKSSIPQKLLSDINDCFDETKTGVPASEISKVIFCYNSSNLNPADCRAAQQVCIEHGVEDFVIFNGAELASLIYNRYPWLAQSHLSIDLGTKEITDYKGFMDHYARLSAGPSLDNPFMLRQDEQLKLRESIEDKQITVIMGKSGVGKTKLAMEVCCKYAQEHAYPFYCVRSYVGISYTDIHKYAAQHTHTIILFDDANKLGNLDDLLLLLTEYRNIRFVLTVRDYASEAISESLSPIIAPADVRYISVSPFSIEDIESLIKDSFGIHNHHYIRRIAALSAGNARLASMACSLVKSEQTLDAIQDASQLYDLYYAKTVKEVFLNQKVLITAGILSAISPYNMNHDYMQPLLDKSGISSSEFRDHIQILSDQEVVDIVHSCAVRFSDQSLQNYLLKLVFLDKEYVQLYELIICAYSHRSSAILDCINTMLNIFTSFDLIEKVKKHVNLAWDFFAESNAACFPLFVEQFAITRPIETLSTIKAAIDALVFEPFDVQSLALTSSTHKDDRITRILHCFRKSENAKEAIQLALQYFDKRPEKGLEIYRLLSDGFSFDPEIIEYTYEREILLTETLLAHINANQTFENTYLFIRLANHLLKPDFSATEYIKNRTISFCSGAIAHTKEAETYRALLWEKANQLYAEPDLRASIRQLVMSYAPRWGRNRADAALVSFDLSCLEALFENHSMSEDVAITMMADHLRTIARNIDIEVIPKSIADCLQSNTYKAIVALRGYDYESHQTPWKDRENHRKNVRIDYAKHVTEHSYLQVMDIYKLLMQFDSETMQHHYTRGLESIALCLATVNESLFLFAISVLMKSTIYVPSNYLQFFQPLFNIVDCEEAYTIVSNCPSSQRALWLFEYFSFIPAEMIDNVTAKQLADYARTEQRMEPPREMDICRLFHYESIQPGIISAFAQSLFITYQDNIAMLSAYFRPLINLDPTDTHDTFSVFSCNLNLLKSIYLALLPSFDLTDDYEGAFLSRLYHHGIINLAEIVDLISEDKHTSNPYERLNFIWNEPNYIELADIIWNRIYTTALYGYYRCEFFTQCPDKYLAQLDTWVMHVIKEHACNPDKISPISALTSDFAWEQRKAYILYFIQLNPSIEAFSRWQLFPLSTSGSPSFVPTYKKRVDALKDLRANISGIEYLDHIAWIDCEIERREIEISQEEIRDFLQELR